MGDGAISVDTVLQAINALYLNPDTSFKEQASKWLCEFQNSLYAWEISDQLLYMNRDLNSCYFGAQTIRIKGLKNSLLEHVRKLTTDTSVPIANQLCLAVADLFCHMVQWQNGIKDIIQRLSDSDVSTGYLIDILKFIPEEMTSSTLRLGLNRRHALMNQLEEVKSHVIELLSAKIKTSQMSMLTRIFNCLASWWDHTGIMTERDIPIAPLLETVFCVLRNPASTPESTYDAATQWVLALLYQCRGYSGTSNGLLTWLQNNIYELVKVVQDCANAVASASGQTQQHEQLELYKDRCICLTQIFSSLIRTLRPSLVDQPEHPGSGGFGDLRMLDCLLVILDLSPPLGSRELAAITFHALHSLADDAIRHRSVIATLPSAPSGPDALGSSPGCGGAKPRPIVALVPYFTRVVVALTRFCPSSTADLESTDELRDFRDDVHDLMQDLLGLVGAETIFVELYNHVQRLQMLAVSANAQVTASEVLREAEACLFMLTTVAKRLSPHDPEGHISALISGLVLPGLAGPCPFPLQEVGCLLYMELSHWAACHPQLRRQIVAQLIGIVEKAAGVETSGLQPGQKLAVGAALSALGSLSSVYRATASTGFNGVTASHLSPAGESTRTGLLDEHWPDLIQRVAYNLPRLAWVPVYDATHFFTGIGRGLISSIGSGGGGVDFDPHPARQVLPTRLAQICSVSLECLTKLMDDNVAVTGTDVLTDPRVWLDYLAAIFRTFGCFLRRLEDGTKQSQWSAGSATAEQNSLAVSAQTCLSECLRLVRECIWPVVARVLTHYATRARPMEHACRLIRFIVRCFSVHLRELLPEIAEKIVLAYTTGGQHSSFLYLASVLVDEFGELPDCRVGLVRVYEALGGPTLKMLHGPGLVQQPHTVEDLYRLCTRLVQHCAAVFLASEQVDLNELCDTAARSLNLCCTGPSAGLSGDDTSGPNSSSDDLSSSSANTSASAAAARFFIDLLIFTGEAAEVTPTQVVQILSSGGQLSTPSSPSSLGAQRVLIWLTNSTPCSGSDVPDCGGQRLVSACLQACCLGYSEERFPELADIIHHLKVMTKNELFLKWLTTAVNSLPILRSDGLVHATVEQIADFKDVIMNSSRSSAIVHALTSFSSLFR
ncbi:Transportin-3 [Paragonimus heterotremus]|uniref:Transportin-3 n=1 Tax=Paragonimus heterotremus TaxID=100268 RepID=A0A8J4SX39_9TREM|nr:Transportin-3 [Paragonimus heterotremus]